MTNQDSDTSKRVAEGRQTEDVRVDDDSAGAVASTRSAMAASWGHRFGLIAAWVILVAVFGYMRPDTYLTVGNFQGMLSSQAVLLILTLGLLPSLAAGELDLSIGGTFGVSVVLLGSLNAQHGHSIGVSVAITLAFGIGVGLVNSILIVKVGIPSIVATLGMGTFLAGIALGITHTAIPGVSATLVKAARTEFLGVQLVFFYGIALTILTWYVFALTPLGRYLFFVGAGRAVARLSGIRVDAIRVGTLMVSAVVSCIAGMLFAGLLGSADPTVGPSFLLPAYSAAFLGATAITPGRFNPWGTFIAVYFLVSGISGLQILGFEGWVVQAFYGASLVLAVLLSHLLGLRQSLPWAST
jgi:ribose transport system permease protein